MTLIVNFATTTELREKLYGVILETHQMERKKGLQDASEKPVNNHEQTYKDKSEQEEQDKSEKSKSKPKKSKGK